MEKNLEASGKKKELARRLTADVIRETQVKAIDHSRKEEAEEDEEEKEEAAACCRSIAVAVYLLLKDAQECLETFIGDGLAREHREIGVRVRTCSNYV